MFRGVTEIRDAYRVDTVARDYIDERFTQPLGALLHDRQVATLKGVIARYQPRTILEVAPGPARLTTEIASLIVDHGIVVDASAQMLNEARRRLGAQTRWRAIQGDAFNLPFDARFDLVYSFRLVRHFDSTDRASLYKQFARVLRPGGVLVFDAVNEAVSRPLRMRAPEEFRHFDAMFQLDALRGELRAHGFEPLVLQGVQHRFRVMQQIQVLVAPRSPRVARWLMELCDRVPSNQPLEWVVVCRRV
jgi:ubiquinone/menaquinone biosynthesis C-methylase UbiE